MTDMSKRALNMIANGAIGNHKLSNSAGVHTGAEEQKELSIFRDFLITKNGCLAMKLGEQIYHG